MMAPVELMTATTWVPTCSLSRSADEREINEISSWSPMVTTTSATRPLERIALTRPRSRLAGAQVEGFGPIDKRRSGLSPKKALYVGAREKPASSDTDRRQFPRPCEAPDPLHPQMKKARCLTDV
jgi:hypothetical protein